LPNESDCTRGPDRFIAGCRGASRRWLQFVEFDRFDLWDDDVDLFGVFVQRCDRHRDGWEPVRFGKPGGRGDFYGLIRVVGIVWVWRLLV